MRRMRVICSRLRGAFVIAAVCVLVAGLLATGAAQAHASGQRAAGATQSGRPCHAGLLVDARDRGEGTAGPRHRGSDADHCADCCLAAHVEATVLPVPPTSLTRSAAQGSAGLAYGFASQCEVDDFLSCPANGARAPPVLPDAN